MMRCEEKGASTHTTHPKKTTTTQEDSARGDQAFHADSERGDQAFHAFVMCFEGIFAEDGSLGLIIQF